MKDSDHWDSVHKRIHTEQVSHSRYAQDKELLFPRGAVVVDLGGGTGSDALFFLQQGHSVILLDISEFAIKEAEARARREKLAEKLVVRQMDLGLEQIPLKDASVDVVYSRLAMHYFPSDQTAKLFKDILRILKPGGKSYLTFKSPEDETEMEHLKEIATEYEPGVYITNGQLRSRFSVDQLNALLTKSEVTVFDVKPYREVVGASADGQEHVLLLNEVVITKA